MKKVCPKNCIKIRLIKKDQTYFKDFKNGETIMLTNIMLCLNF